MGKKIDTTLLFAVTLLLWSCSASNPPSLSKGHLSIKEDTDKKLPAPIVHAPILPAPVPKPKLETYTVVVSDVAVKQLLFSLARDAKLNVDIHPSVSGKVTLNAVNQTLPQILERISKQVNLRYEVKNSTIIITPDLPYWQNYQVNYVNMERKSLSEVSVATQIATTGGTTNTSSAQSSSTTGNQNGNTSKTKVTNTSQNSFWKTMVTNLNRILGQSSSSGTSSNNVVANPMSGVISVKATQKQHREIQAFIEQVMTNAQRQVLIEITIVEVELGNRFQTGIDWQRLSKNAGAGSNGLSFISNLLGANLSTPPVFSIGYNRTTNSNSLSGTIKMLESFGNVKVISSPKLMALNNQTALLKVVDEKVYFTVELQITDATTNTPQQKIYTSSVHTVPVGLVMSIMPQINENGSVSLNIRPTISRITGFATDPAPSLMGQNFNNLIPEIQIREMESLIQVSDGQTIVMGGLMQNKINKKDKAIPGMKKVPKIRNLLSYKDHDFTKTELVIFLRPTIVKNGRTPKQLSRYKHYLPVTKTAHAHKQPGKHSPRHSHTHKGSRNVK